MLNQKTWGRGMIHPKIQFIYMYMLCGNAEAIKWIVRYYPSDINAHDMIFDAYDFIEEYSNEKEMHEM